MHVNMSVFLSVFVEWRTE